MKARLLLFLPLVLSATAALGASYVVPTDRELIQRSARIVVGTVAGQQAMVEGPRIVTELYLDVEETVKGAGSSRLTVRIPGGVVGERAMIVSTSPRFEPGERALLLLGTDARGWRILDGQLGKFSFVRDLESNRYLVRGATVGEVFGWTPAGMRHEERARDAEAFLEFARAVSRGERAGEDYFRPWPAERSALKVEAESHVTGNSYLMQFGFSQPGGARWPGGAFTMLTSGSQNGVPDPATVFDVARAAWNDDPGSNINIGRGGTTSTFVYGESNDVNVIYFGQPNSGELGGSTVGQATLFAIGARNTFNGEQFYTADECDIIVEQGLSGNVLAEVVAHEAGHCLGFRHSNEGTPTSTNALMNASVVGVGPVLRDWDRDAAAHVYGAPSQCSLPSITAQPQSRTIDSGQSTTLSVSATGATAFQWFLGESGNEVQPIVGATSPSFNTGVLGATQRFWVKASNSCGSVNSQTATVTVNVCALPVVTQQPRNGTFPAGTPVALTISLSGTQPFQIQWYEGARGVTNRPIPGATGGTLIVSPAATTSYWARISNACGTTDSQAATITITGSQPPPASRRRPVRRP